MKPNTLEFQNCSAFIVSIQVTELRIASIHGGRRCLAECRPGSSLQQLHALSVRLLREGLRSLGILGPLASSNAYRAFYPHAVGA